MARFRSACVWTAWTGAALSVGLFVFSIVHPVRYTSASEVRFKLCNGSLSVILSAPYASVGWSECRTFTDDLTFVPSDRPWLGEAFCNTDEYEWVPWPCVRSLGATSQVFMPLWLPLLVSITIGWFLHRPTGRTTALRCACGYSRAGLLAGHPCPECGRAAI